MPALSSRISGFLGDLRDEEVEAEEDGVFFLDLDADVDVDVDVDEDGVDFFFLEEDEEEEGSFSFLVANEAEDDSAAAAGVVMGEEDGAVALVPFFDDLDLDFLASLPSFFVLDFSFVAAFFVLVSLGFLGFGFSMVMMRSPRPPSRCSSSSSSDMGVETGGDDADAVADVIAVADAGALASSLFVWGVGGRDS